MQRYEGLSGDLRTAKSMHCVYELLSHGGTIQYLVHTKQLSKAFNMLVSAKI